MASRRQTPRVPWCRRVGSTAPARLRNCWLPRPPPPRARAAQLLALPRSIWPPGSYASPGWAISPGWCGRLQGVMVWLRIMVLSGTTCAADRCSPIPGLQTRCWCCTPTASSRAGASTPTLAWRVDIPASSPECSTAISRASGTTSPSSPWRQHHLRDPGCCPEKSEIAGMRILMVTLQRESDLVLTRQRARQIAAMLGFETQDQTRIATAVSEIARNALTYAGGGNVEFHLEGQTRPQVLQVSVRDQGPGIPHLQAILDGQYQSPTGLGLGLRGAQRLMDQVHIASAPGQGTTVRLQKLLPRQAPVLTGRRLHQFADTLTQQRPHDPLTEVQQQNQELLHTLEALRALHEHTLGL